MADNDRFVYPILAAGPTRVTSTTAWVFTAYVEIVPASTITTTFAIEGITFMNSPLETATAAAYSTLISIGKGAASSETEIIQIPMSWRWMTAAGYPNMTDIDLPEGIEVAANTRIAVRVASNEAAARTFGGFKIKYSEMAAVGGATSLIFSRRDSSRGLIMRGN